MIGRIVELYEEIDCNIRLTSVTNYENVNLYKFKKKKFTKLSYNVTL